MKWKREQSTMEVHNNFIQLPFTYPQQSGIFLNLLNEGFKAVLLCPGLINFQRTPKDEFNLIDR